MFENLLGGHSIKLLNEIIVKFDVQIKKIETKILKKIHDLFDRNIICIFCVYCFFIHNSLEYIVMKYVKYRVIWFASIFRIDQQNRTNNENFTNIRLKFI